MIKKLAFAAAIVLNMLAVPFIGSGGSTIPEWAYAVVLVAAVVSSLGLFLSDHNSSEVDQREPRRARLGRS